jgi:hypothetical protein
MLGLRFNALKGYKLHACGMLRRPCRNGKQVLLNRRAKTIQKNGIKIKYNFKIKGWKRGHIFLKTSEQREGKENKKTINLCSKLQVCLFL